MYEWVYSSIGIGCVCCLGQGSVDKCFNRMLEKTDNIIRGDEISDLYFMYCWDKYKDYPANDLEDPDVIILNNLQLDENYKKEWPCYYAHDEIPWDKIEKMTIVYKDKDYTVWMTR